MPWTASDDCADSMPNTNSPATRVNTTRTTSITHEAIRAATLATGTSTATPSPVTRSSVA